MSVTHWGRCAQKGGRTKGTAGKVSWMSPRPLGTGQLHPQRCSPACAAQAARTYSWGVSWDSGSSPLLPFHLPCKLLYTPQSPAWRCLSLVKLPCHLGSSSALGALVPHSPGSPGRDVWVPSSPASPWGQAGERPGAEGVPAGEAHSRPNHPALQVFRLIIQLVFYL